MTEFIVVIVTCASPAEAEHIAEQLVAERLAACGTTVPNARSIFRWQGQVNRESEVLLLLKTRAALFARLRDRTRQLHSYEVPEIIALPIAAGDESYLAWLQAETQTNKA